MAVQRVSHIGICVSDLGRALSFYCDLLGFKPAARASYSGAAVDRLLGLSNVALRAAWIERDGTRLELLEFTSPGHAGSAAPRAMNALGLPHLSLRVADVAATTQQLAEAGVMVLDATRYDDPQRGVAAVFVLDPDGTRVELVQIPGDPARLPGSPAS
jgi:catechol 2,3-dioxygenase-like lactoylglutathione lyase family enzyme